MVKVEINSTEGPLFCPFCGLDLVTEQGFSDPCPHVLYQCCEDGGVQFCADDLNEELQRKIDETSMDQATDDILGKKAIKFAMYSEAPMANFAVYVGIRTDLLQKQ